MINGYILNFNKTTGEQLYIDLFLTGNHYESSEYANFFEDSLIFSPAFLFNLITILENNTILAVPTTDDLNNLKKNGIPENSDEVKVHKDGRAIDFFLPAFSEIGDGTTRMDDGSIANVMPFIYPRFLGDYSLKKEAYIKFENILQIYFDKVIRSKQILNIDINKSKGIVLKTPVTTPYAVYIYHIEVNDRNFLNPITEIKDHPHVWFGAKES